MVSAHGNHWRPPRTHVDVLPQQQSEDNQYAHPLDFVSILDLHLENVEGNSIVWQKWHIRTSFKSREGLVLHNVGYDMRMKAE
ncbi:hypothetical protein WJX77_003301 [Trebouxia sp. C0004]